MIWMSASVDVAAVDWLDIPWHSYLTSVKVQTAAACTQALLKSRFFLLHLIMQIILLYSSQALQNVWWTDSCRFTTRLYLSFLKDYKQQALSSSRYTLCSTQICLQKIPSQEQQFHTNIIQCTSKNALESYSFCSDFVFICIHQYYPPASQGWCSGPAAWWYSLPFQNVVQFGRQIMSYFLLL